MLIKLVNDCQHWQNKALQRIYYNFSEMGIGWKSQLVHKRPTSGQVSVICLSGCLSVFQGRVGVMHQNVMHFKLNSLLLNSNFA